MYLAIREIQYSFAIALHSLTLDWNGENIALDHDITMEIVML